jgi:2-(1,2-epoxy-1,2-dihydrophenyl)acetyl-CoA isomerase
VRAREEFGVPMLFVSHDATEVEAVCDDVAVLRAGRVVAQGPTAAYARVKRAMRASLANDIEAQLALEARLQGECGRTQDFREGVDAFLEKRPARFQGR